VFLLLFIYLISIGSAVYTAYLIYTNEFKSTSEALIDDDDVKSEALSDTVYVGKTTEVDAEAPVMVEAEEIQSKPDPVEDEVSASSVTNKSTVVTEKETPMPEKTSVVAPTVPKYNRQSRPRRTPLNVYNILNFIAAYVMALYTADIDLDPEYEFFSRFNLWVFAERYEQGAMTPAAPFFFMFIGVALFCAVFGVVQLLPAFRAHPMVRGIKHWFFLAVAAQVAAYITGANEEDSLLEKCLSTFFFAVMAVSVYIILENQANSVSDGTSTEYWLL